MYKEKVIPGDSSDVSPFIKSTILKQPVVNPPLSNAKSRTSNVDTKTYDTTNKKRGVALIFNHYKYMHGRFMPRDGTNKDRDDIRYVLKRLQFDVRVYNDQTYDQLKGILEKVAKEDHTDSDCFIVVMMSHGECGYLYASDMAFPINELWDNFFGKNCETLIGKPKLFFLNACRGEKVDSGAQYVKQKDDTDMVRKPKKFIIPQTADLLVMYSTYEGYYSWRNPEMGSCFIQALCKELFQNWKTDDLLSILTSVSRRVAYEFQTNVPDDHQLDCTKQIPNFKSMLTKSFFFTKQHMTWSKQKIWSELYFNFFDLLGWYSSQTIWESMKFSLSTITEGLTANSKYYSEISKQYDMSNKKRGIALIFNHNKFKTIDKRRIGSTKDCENIKKILEKLRFSVRVYNFVKYSTLIKILEKLANENHTDNDCIAVFVLSHGDKDGVHANDSVYSASELWNPFMSTKCTSLIGKPKLFFINACRGNWLDSGVICKQNSMGSDDNTDFMDESNKMTTYFIPEMTDLLVMYSTYEGYRSWINKTKGSYYVWAFCAELSLKWKTNDLLTILTGIAGRVAHEYKSHVPEKYDENDMKQMPCINSTLTKKIYFN